MLMFSQPGSSSVLVFASVQQWTATPAFGCTLGAAVTLRRSEFCWAMVGKLDAVISSVGDKVDRNEKLLTALLSEQVLFRAHFDEAIVFLETRLAGLDSAVEQVDSRLGAVVQQVQQSSPGAEPIANHDALQSAPHGWIPSGECAGATSRFSESIEELKNSVVFMAKHMQRISATLKEVHANSAEAVVRAKHQWASNFQATDVSSATVPNTSTTRDSSEGLPIVHEHPEPESPEKGLQPCELFKSQEVEGPKDKMAPPASATPVTAELANLRQLADTLTTLPPPVSAFNETDLVVRAKLEKLHAVIRARLMAGGLDGPSMRLIMMHMAGLSHCELKALLETRPDLAGYFLDQL